MFKNPAALKEGAKWGSLFTSIIVGGTAIIAPLVVLENKKNKKKIITHINNTVHGKETVQNDSRFAQELVDVENEPKKSFAVGMAARLIVLTPMIAATVHAGTNKQMIKYLYNPIAKFSKGTCEMLGIRPKGLMSRGVMEHAEGDLSKPATFFSDWDFIHRTIGFDVGLTTIYSFAHEATIKALASFGYKLTEDKKQAAEQKSLADAALQEPDKTIAVTPEHSQRVHKRDASFEEEFIQQPETAIAETLR